MKTSIIVVVLCWTLWSCGTTHIVVDNGSNAEIYINNVYKGKQDVEIHRVGLPQKIMITAKYQGTTIGTKEIWRKPTLGSCVAGCFSYGIGFFCTWSYPEYIIIPVVKPQDKENIWNPIQKSPWEQPLNR